MTDRKALIEAAKSAQADRSNERLMGEFWGIATPAAILEMDAELTAKDARLADSDRLKLITVLDQTIADAEARIATLEAAMAELVDVVAINELIPESVSFMRAARAALENKP